MNVKNNKGVFTFSENAGKEKIMIHPIEELFSKNFSDHPTQAKAIRTILHQLNRIWDIDLSINTVTKADLVGMIEPHPDLKDITEVDEILNFLVNAFHDHQTLSIVMRYLRTPKQEWATILAGFYGKKARRAIPEIRYNVGGQVFPMEAELAFRRIGGMSLKVLFAGLQVAIREADSQGFFLLLRIIKKEFPDYKTDPKFEKIVSMGLRKPRASLGYYQANDWALESALFLRSEVACKVLPEMPLASRQRLRKTIERLANDKDDKIKAVAAKLLAEETP